MSYQYILFDLDGTLTDSGPGIEKSVAYALRQLGKPVPERAILRRFIGPPLTFSFPYYSGIPAEQVPEAIRLYRENYSEKGGIFENSPYPGVIDFLRELKAAGKTVMVATSKPLPMAIRVLEHFDMSRYFDGVYGGTMDESGNGCVKSVIVGQAIAACGPEAAGKLLMVGDREHDIIGAHENGIPCVGVLWGYGSREEFAEAGAEYIVGSCEELGSIIL